MGIVVCETDGGGQCKAPPASSVTLEVAEGQTPTFGVFVSGNGTTVPLDPATNRAFFEIRANGQVVGRTSVALQTVAGP